jgi:hypothetical protein
MRKLKWLILPLILIVYAFLYIATTKNVECEGDCDKVYQTGKSLSNSRTYVLSTYRCTLPGVSDTLCIYVKDTIGINWNLFADTVCIIATQQGLIRQKIFVLKNGTSPPDTLARKVCP